MVKPRHILIFLTGILTTLGSLMLVYPSDGIVLGDLVTLKFPPFEKFFFDEKQQYVDISNIIAAVDSSLHENDSINIQTEEEKPGKQFLQFPNDNKTILDNFFRKLESAKAENRLVHILHIGDSQIEGDRISAYLRNKLQKRFGGYGPGLLSLLEIFPRSTVVQQSSENWKRYTNFGRVEEEVPHSKYGVMMSFSKFTPFITLRDSTGKRKVHQAWVKIKPSSSAYATSQEFTRMRLFYGPSSDTLSLTLLVNDELATQLKEVPLKQLNVFEYNFGSTPKYVELILESKTSPDFYAMELSTPYGVMLDNIALRGSSGTDFVKTESLLWSRMMEELNAELLLLQFGGNAVPYIKDEEAAARYGNWFYTQLMYLKKAKPGIAIVVIGPSDMSYKEGENYVSYPLLPKIRDALKEATLKAGGAFWDMYNAMGGKNSMPSWVNADPPLAAPDYTHFTPKGAAYIAELFYDALIAAYNDYLKRKKSEERIKAEESDVQ